MNELTIKARLENLSKVLDFVDGFLMSLDCSPKTQTQIDLSVEEMFVNVANYAYAPGTGPVTVQVEELADPAAVQITFIDEGKPFDPTAKSDPDVTLPAEERQIGGLGIFMVRKYMDKMTYEYTDNKNVLRLVKNL